MSDIDEPIPRASTPQNCELEVTKLPHTNTDLDYGIDEVVKAVSERDENSKDGSQEAKHFAGPMEGELDFEDFNENPGRIPVLGENEKIHKEVWYPGNQSNATSVSQKLTPSDCEKTVDSKDHEESEDGQCTTPEKKREKNKDLVEEDEERDDGELCSDGEEDLEDGELKDENEESFKQPARQVCRFFHRGLCFYGSCCRFLHLNNFDERKGNYSMFERYTDSLAYGPGNIISPNGIMNHRIPRSVPDPFIPSPVLPPQQESAWERGLKEARILVKKANKRKEEEPDFEHKRLNLSLVVNEKNIPEYDKENDCKPKRERRKSSERDKRERGDYFKYHTHETVHKYNDNFEVDSYSKQKAYENFEVRYSHGVCEKDDRERGSRRKSIERGNRFSKTGRRWNDLRIDEVESRSRSDEFFDPWRRSKSPKGNRTSRSGSYSPSGPSSYSYSSRSSCSYSRSSSRSSCRSSRSPSIQQKRKQSPPPETAVSPKERVGTNRFGPVKKKPGLRTSSSRSRSMSRTPSRSRSRSLSMDSVSSASTHSSGSSSGSESLRQRNAHVSLRKPEEKPVMVQKADVMSMASSSLYAESTSKFNKLDKVGALDDERDPLEEKFQKPVDVATFPSLQHLMPNFPDKPKEPVKGLPPHKQLIKLTLLNKNPQSKLTNLPKKDIEVIKKSQEEPSKMNLFQLGVKRPLSPPANMQSLPAKPAPVLIPKKSASSRRDELLKQLKAVEDAIARKRAKFC